MNTTTPDSLLLKRRRTIEAATLISRGTGMLGTAMFVFGVTGTGELAVTIDGSVRVVCSVGLVIMTVAAVFSVMNILRPQDEVQFQRLNVAQAVMDTVTISALALIQLSWTGQTLWPLLAIPIVLTAVRTNLKGAMLTWMFTVIAMLTMNNLSADHIMLPQDVMFASGLFFNVALIAGSQGSAFAKHLTELQKFRRKLQHQATHDHLTGLPNRELLSSHADALNGRALALLLLDLNGFKQVNDTLGHAAGDILLQEVSHRLQEALRDEDMAGRLGGDEFLVLLPDTDPQAAEGAAKRLRAAISRPIKLDGEMVQVGASIGIACRDAGGTEDLGSLARHADIAMYRDKTARKAHVL